MDDSYIRRVLSGDVNSFKYLVDRYKDMAYSIAISILKDAVESEDVVQESFIRAFKNLKKFRGKSNFSTWLYRIVINESLGRLRKKKTQPVANLSECPDMPSETEIENAISYISKEERSRYINYVMNLMDSRESLLLRLFYLNENSLNEMEEITGFTLANIRVILHRGRKNFYLLLKSVLKEETKSLL